MRSLSLIAVVVGLALPARAATFTVNSTLDTDDATNDSVCDDGAGHCTLRAAITQAIEASGGTIQFAIAGSGVHTFMPATPYRPITASITLDATTQPGWVLAGPPLIEINGAGAGVGAKGFSVATVAGSTINVTISGFAIYGFDGPAIVISAAKATVSSNYIGLTAAGAQSGNGGGISASSSATAPVTIGGASGSLGNVISGNRSLQLGIGGSGAVVENNHIGTNATGTMVVDATANGISVGSSVLVESNIISGHDTAVLLTGSGATLDDNAIGVDASQSVALGNNVGVHVQGNSNIVEYNTIAGNSQTGVWLDGCSANNIFGNYIGTNGLGSGGIGNATGVLIGNNAAGNTIGSTSISNRNIISGNTDGLVYASGTSGANTVVGNWIGLDSSGAARGNTRYGVDMTTASNTTLGGSGGALPNVISANGTAGVHVGATGTPAVSILGNYIGTSSDGAGARGNGVGVRLEGSVAVVIGSAGGGNVIAGNNGAGIELLSNTATTKIAANFIGTNAGGAAIANQRGVLIDGGSHDNLVGDPSGGGNRIAFNLQEGILVNSGNLNQIERNSIVGNGALGIDLAPIGVNTNQVSGAGPNGLMPFPTLTSATNDGTNLWVAGTMGPGNMQVAAVVELFSSASCDPSGYGEGDTFVARNAVATDTHGAFLVMLPMVAVGQTVSATAFDMNLGTSEFSPCLTVKACPTLAVAPTTLPDGSILQSYSQTVTASGGTSPYAFSVTAGAIPTGLTLAADGTLSGTPTAAGTFNFTVGASDATHCLGARSLSLFVAAPGLDLGGPDLAVGGQPGDDAGASDDLASAEPPPDLATGAGGKSGCSFAAGARADGSPLAIAILLLALVALTVSARSTRARSAAPKIRA